MASEYTRIGCEAIVPGGNGTMHPCGRPVAAIRQSPACGGDLTLSGVCADHLDTDLPRDPTSRVFVQYPWPWALRYEDETDGVDDDTPREGDYGVAVRDSPYGQDEVPFLIARDGDTGLPVAVLDVGLNAKPGGVIEDGQCFSLFQLFLDGFALTRTGRKGRRPDMTLEEMAAMGCAATVTDGDGIERPCGKPVVAIRRWTEHGDGDGIGGVCAKHAAEPGAVLVPLDQVSSATGGKH